MGLGEEKDRACRRAIAATVPGGVQKGTCDCIEAVDIVAQKGTGFDKSPPLFPRLRTASPPFPPPKGGRASSPGTTKAACGAAGTGGACADRGLLRFVWLYLYMGIAAFPQTGDAPLFSLASYL